MWDRTNHWAYWQLSDVTGDTVLELLPLQITLVFVTGSTRHMPLYQVISRILPIDLETSSHLIFASTIC
jgi:hypothetical protein